MKGQKILFLQQHPFPYFGIMSISGVLTRHNFQTEVLIGLLEKDILRKIEEISPDIIGFSIMSSDESWLRNLSGQIKKKMDVSIVAGGVHASSCPEIIEDPNIDYVIIGEGEYVFLRFVTEFFKGNKTPVIDGVITKFTGKESYYNAGKLIDVLDELPFEDRDIYYRRYSGLRNTPLKQFISGRGCPFDCNFCFNSFYKTLFKGKGEYVRRKSPGYFVEEIKRVREKYNLKSLFFADDLFTLDLKWLSEFCEIYTREIGLSFMCAATANLVTENVAEVLKKAGCNCISFGIETGSEEKRRKILNKNISNDEIRKCAGILKKYGIKIQTSNIFAFPGETVDDAFETIRLNSEIKTDYMFSTLMMPLPKTGLEKMAREQNILPDNYDYTQMPVSFHSKSIFDFKDIRILENIHKISYIAMKFPRYEKFFRWLARKNWGKLFFLLFAVSFIYRYKAERKMSFLGVLGLFWDFRKSY
ncbi:MAG: radical SAM protein [Candidatus Omnitrophota bacterium]